MKFKTALGTHFSEVICYQFILAPSFLKSSTKLGHSFSGNPRSNNKFKGPFQKERNQPCG